MRAEAAEAWTDGHLNPMFVIAWTPKPGAHAIVPGEPLYCEEATEGLS